MKFEYQATDDFGKPLRERLGMYPRVPDITWDALRWLGSWLAVLIIRSQFKLTVKGTLRDMRQGKQDSQKETDQRTYTPEEHAPKKYAIVANHQSHLDTITILTALPGQIRRQVSVLAAEDYFFTKTHWAILASLLSQAVAYDRVHRTTIRSWMRYLKNTETGWLLFYPSGSRHSQELHSGLLKMLVRQGWAILPVRLTGTDTAWPPHAPIWKPFRELTVTFFEPYAGSDLDVLMEKLNKELGYGEQTTESET